MSNKTRVTGFCDICGKEYNLVVETDGFLAWKHGALIDQALPELSEDDQFLLENGMHRECHDSICADVGDAEDACAMY